MFVLVRARLQHPLLIKDLLATVCHPSVLKGEGGYYLTVFEASLEHIRTLELNEFGELKLRSFMM